MKTAGALWQDWTEELLMIEIGPADALIIVDVQNDFLPGGALAVRDGGNVIAPINALSAGLPFGIVVATQDWHTPDHASFDAQGGPWPSHCVAGSPGAALAASLSQSAVAAIIRKGRLKGRDSYSGFLDNDHVSETGLSGLLRALGIRRVFVCGLAYDFCVSATALNAVDLGFGSFVIEDATQGIGDDLYAIRHRLDDGGVIRVERASLMAAPDDTV